MGFNSVFKGLKTRKHAIIKHVFVIDHNYISLEMTKAETILTPPTKKKKAHTLPCLRMSASVNIFCPVCEAEICHGVLLPTTQRTLEGGRPRKHGGLVTADVSHASADNNRASLLSSNPLDRGGKCVGKLDKHISIISAFCKYSCHCSTFAGGVLWWRPWCRFQSVKRHRI